MKILISIEAVNYLDELIEILYRKEYFGFIESAEIYVANIYEFIETSIDRFPPKESPVQLQYYGKQYIFFKINAQTTWYIFFESEANNYLITHITNNHSKEAKWL